MNRLGGYLFIKFGSKFVWLDYLIRNLKIASNIDVFDAENNIVNIDGNLMCFYPKSKSNFHYQKYSKSGKSREELNKLLCSVDGLNIKF